MLTSTDRRTTPEPIVYARSGEGSAGNGSFAELVVEGAGRLAQLGPDVLKLQHPGSGAGVSRA